MSCMDFRVGEDILAEGYGLRSYLIPKFLVEKRMGSIRATSFKGLEGLDGHNDFRVRVGNLPLQEYGLLEVRWKNSGVSQCPLLT